MFYSILPLKGSQENSPEMENTTSTSPTARLSPSMSGRDKANLLDRKFADAKRNSRSKFAATKHQESSPQPSTAPSGNDPVKLQRIYSILNAKRSTPSKAPQPQEQRSSSGENGLAAKSTSSQETTLGLRSGVRDASSLGLASLNSAASYRDLMIAKRNAFKQRMIQNEAAMRSAAEDSAETTIEAQPPKPDSQPPVKSLLDHAPVQETPVPDTPRETRQARAAVEKQTVKSARKRSSPSKSPSPEKTPSKVTKTVPASEAHTPSNSRPSSAPSSGRTRRATRGPVPRAPFQGPAIPAAAATAIKSSSFANVTRASDRTSAAVISEDLSPAEKSRKTMSDSELHAKRIEEKTKPEFSAVEPQPTIIEKETLQVDSTPQKPASNGPGLFVEDTDNDDDVPLSAKRVLFSSDIELSPPAQEPAKTIAEPKSILKMRPHQKEDVHSAPVASTNVWPSGHIIQKKKDSSESIAAIRSCCDCLATEGFQNRFEAYASINCLLKNNSKQYLRTSLNDTDTAKILNVISMELTHAEENPKILTDPFEVRIAIQAMKGLTVLLSVFQIPDAERIVRQVIELSQTPNLAKGLVSAYVQFCKEQNCILSSGCIELLIDAMLKIPYYPSATILNEKLLTLKSYISRSPAVMLKLCESWQQFVLSCVMSVECPSYDRLMKVTLSLYAEFSKICNRTTRQTCFNILDMESHTLTQSYPVIASLEAFKTNKSVCDAVVEALTALIHRKEYETAMELWAHLLYISSSFTWKNGLETWNHLVSWISVFTTCFNDEGETPKLAALHAWRSVIFSYQYSLSFKTSAVLESEAEEYQLKSKFHVLAHPLRSFSGEIDEPLMSAYETLFTRLYYSLYRFLSKNPVSGGDREGWVIDWVVELVKDLCFGTTTSSIQVEVGYSILTQLFSTTPQKSKQTFKMTAKDCFLGSSGEDLQLPTLNPGWVCIRRSDFVQLLTKALSYDYADSLARLKLMISFLDASKNGQSALDSYRYIEDLPVLSKAIFGSSLGKNRIQFADLRESMLEMVQKFGFQAMLTPSADIPCFFILALQYYSVEETNDAALNSTCVDLLHFTLEHDHSSYISVCQMLIQLNSGRFADDVAGSLLESASYVHTLGSFESWKTIKEYLSPELFIDLLVRLVELGCELKKDPKLVFEEQVRFWKSIGLFEYGMPYLVVLFHRLRTTPATHPISTFWLAFLIDFEAEPEVSTAALLLETLGLGNSCASEEYALVHSYVAKVSAAAPESKPVQDLTVALQNLQSLLDMRKDQVSAFVSSLTPPLQILPPEEPSAVDLPEEEPLVSETEPEKEPQGQENETEAEPPVSENVPAEKPSAPENEPTAVEQPSSLDNSQIATEPETLVISSGDEEQEPHTAPEVQQPDSQPPSQAEKRPVLDSSDRSSQAVPPPQRNFSSNGQTHSTSETNLAQLQSTPQPQVFPDPYNPLRPATFDPDQSVYSDAGRLAPYPPPFPYPGYPFYPPMMRPPPMGQPDANPYSMYYWNPYQMPPPPAGPGPILDQSDPEDWVHLEGLVTRLNQTHANGVVELDETKKRKLEDDLFSLLTCLKKRR